MVNHPNRSKLSRRRFIAYSVVSLNALSSASTIETARGLAEQENGVGSEFLVVVEDFSNIPLHHLDTLPHDAVIVWRGSNELAQNFKLFQLV